MKNIKNLNLEDVKFSERFNKQLKKSPDEIKAAFWENFYLFLEEPKHSSLRNHALRRKFAGFRSINITEDWRALFKESTSKERKIIIFYMMGTHKQLYKK